jgi:hypothetical protein
MPVLCCLRRLPGTYRTAWLVSLTDDTFTWVATNHTWTVGPTEVVAVRGEASDQILVIVTRQSKIFVWAQFNDRVALFDAIKYTNPAVTFDPWFDAIKILKDN